jgi:hypothetical protein
VLTGPGDERAAAHGRSQGRLRASHAEREQAVGVLKDAFVQGRLDKGELDARVGRALASRTCAELAALTADLPAGPTAAPPVRRTARTKNRTRSHTARDVAVGLVIGLLVAAVIVFGGLLRYDAFGVLALPVLAAAPLVMVATLSQQSRSRRQLPPQPGQGGQAPEVQRPSQVSHNPPLPPDRPDQAHADLPAGSSRPSQPYASRREPRKPWGARPVPDAV